MGRTAAFLIAILSTGCAPTLEFDPEIADQVSGDSALFIGISPINETIVWISGVGGTYGRTLDGGQTWETGIVPGADTLQFRDVHGVDASTAYLLSIGSGSHSRIYKTRNAGQDWTLQFTNPEPQGFFDCMGFWDADHGIVFSDSFDGHFYIVVTEDGGATWTRVPSEGLPAARAGEGSFAASGLCLLVGGDSTAWIGTGASAEGQARVLRTADRGKSWTFADTPLTGEITSGITSVAFIDEERGAVLGGNVADMESRDDNVAWTTDGGSTWTMTAARPEFPGPVYGAAFVPGAPTPTLVAVGPNGLGYTIDGGGSWVTLSEDNYWSVAFASPQAGWATGPGGRITKLDFYR